MIVTLTANPSVDRTVELGGPLERGAVLRATGSTDDPGGKGVNVARALAASGVPALAVLPAADDDPILGGLRAHGIEFAAVPIHGCVRTNITVTEPDGTTTKINEAGHPLDGRTVEALLSEIRTRAAHAEWVVLSGSLPPGVPTDWYATVVLALAGSGCRVAVDTSDAPLLALSGGFPGAAPDLVKPNSEELAQLTGADGDALEAAARAGDPRPATIAARGLVEKGVGSVLVTLGAAGAVLVDASGAWFAAAPPVTARSTVGAGDSALAGYLVAHRAGAGAARCLQSAVAYGSAAASLPGTTLPSASDVALDPVEVRPVPGGGPDRTGTTPDTPVPAHTKERP
ncbi:1-phosphofructokinase family hexose kinase [Rhodococcus triatomae]|uniref:1-phosphofructokinase n=1 Tax=Rhodococcus triatomae TaxID=300028 RepID=A0A1G8MUX1_9NOCA|nr:1-phosphofructokinase family hexose kinase [Rhodococcus triatomae]QNG19101.1 1-phosphofructokinase family hexose kinase [Rhodococcus triatomae]QNG24986.1 1-phosphofructokinase family hexose kinase [Rhodococcus triatomae]SDI71818.1 1-phosphofructokinase [Rhodococcus triatomae]